MKKNSIILKKLDDIWFWTKEYFKDWIYPGYYLKNLLFNRYDRVKLKQIKPWEYSDVVERMLYANMELIRFFIDKEKPEEVVQWYPNDTYEGTIIKFNRNDNPRFPELEGKYVMDIIKKIYSWWTVGLSKDEADCDYLNKVYYEYFGRSEIKEMGLDDLDEDEVKFTEPLDWSILDRYSDGNRENLFKRNFINKKIMDLETKIDNDKRYYLHLCIEVREYLWV